MRISPISYSRTNNYLKQNTNKNLNKNQNLNTNLSSASNLNSDLSFTATRADFETRYTNVVIRSDLSKIRLLEGDEEHLTEIGEYLRTTPNDVIYDYFAERRSGDTRKEADTKKAYQRLLPYVRRARRDYDSLEKTLEILGEVRKEIGQNKTLDTKIRTLEDKKIEMDKRAERAMELTEEHVFKVPCPARTNDDYYWWD